MANKKNAELKLKEALRLTRKEREQEMDAGCETKELHRFSKEFERKISKLFQKKKRPVCFRSKGYAIRMGAAVTSLLLFGTILVGIQVDAIQMPEINFTLTTLEDHSEMRMVEDEAWGIGSAKYVKELYQPRKLPVGYKRMEDGTGIVYRSVKYTNGRHPLVFHQMLDTTKIRVNSEYGEGEKMIVNQNVYYYYSVSGKSSMLIWSKGDCRFQIIGDVSADTMIKMAENVENVK